METTILTDVAPENPAFGHSSVREQEVGAHTRHGCPAGLEEQVGSSEDR
jgi:hypothetical protein